MPEENVNMQTEKTPLGAGVSFADVIIPLALPKTFTWSVPQNLLEAIKVGCRVEVNLGKNKKYAGVVKKFEEDYNNCTIRYGDMKAQLGEDLVKFVAPIREKAETIRNDAAYLKRSWKKELKKQEEVPKLPWN